jgi:hypothetical protein
MGAKYPEGFNATMCIEEYPHLWADHHRFRIFARRMMDQDRNLTFTIPKGKGRVFTYTESPYKILSKLWDNDAVRRGVTWKQYQQ